MQRSASYDIDHVHDVILGRVSKEPPRKAPRKQKAVQQYSVETAVVPPNTGPAQTPPTHRRNAPSSPPPQPPDTVAASHTKPLPVLRTTSATVSLTKETEQGTEIKSVTIEVERAPVVEEEVKEVPILPKVERTKLTSVMAHPWVNRAEEIIKAEIGVPEFNRRLERQNTLFQKGCKKGGFTDLFSMFLLSSKVKSHYADKTKATKRRAAHIEGVGALGYAVFEPDARVPSNEFFTQGRIHEVRARHANSPWSDDRRMGYRSLSLKFADHHKDSPFDLILQTGYLSQFFNGDSVEDHMVAMEKRGDHVKNYLLSLPIYMQAVIDGFRKRPESYVCQHYHSQIVFDFRAKDGKPRVGRIRVVPADGSRESGRLSSQEQKDAWSYMVQDKHEQDIPPNYLKIEFAERIRAGPISYKLQIQLHDVGSEDDHMVYNPSIPWDAAEHPWMDLAAIHLTAMLPNDVIELTRFNVGRLPKNTLSFPEATSVYDFNIVPNLRHDVYEYCQKIRPAEAEETGKGCDTEYLIHVVTGNHSHAGNTDSKCNVYVSIVGTTGRTSYLKLHRKTRNDFAEHAQATFCVIDKNVGDFVCLKIYKDRKGSRTDWLCESVIFTTPYNGRCFKLSCHRWLTDDTPCVTLRPAHACLDLQEKNSYLLLMRSLEVATKRNLYRWANRDDDSNDPYKGFPGYLANACDIHDLPHDFRFEKQKELDSEWSLHNHATTSFIKTIKHMFKSRGGTIQEEYGEVVTGMLGKEISPGLEYTMLHWKDDREFVRQLINICAPLKIAELQEMPRSFPVRDAMLEGILDKHRTLKEELEDGNIFIVTFPELEEFAQYDVTEEQEAEMESEAARLAEDNVSIAESLQLSFDVSDSDKGEHSDHSDEGAKSTDKTKKSSKTKKSKKGKKPKAKPPKILRKYLCAPQVLLLKREGVLIPLAIQLTQQPHTLRTSVRGDVIRPAPVIYTMRDSGGAYSDWLVAKMWVKTAAAHTQHLSMHILGCHLLAEPIALSVFRNLPSSHPAHKLLAPPLRHIVGINAIYRKHVLPHEKALSEFLGIGQDKGHMHDFIRQQYSQFKLNLLSLPDSYAERGVLEEDTVPGYLYRDDSLRVWEAIHQYVKDVLSLYYPDDATVTKDDELAAMLLDLRRHGLHRRSDIPERFATLSALSRFVTNVIYRCTAHHSVTCQSMRDVYTFAPNAPPTMMRPPPRAKRGIAGWDEDVVRFMLPPPELVERYIETMQLMNQPYDHSMTLGNATEQLFTEEKVLNAGRKFRKRLEDIDSEITERNSKLDVAFDYFKSKNIMNGIYF